MPEDEIRFQTQYTFDANTNREFQAGYYYSRENALFFQILTIVYNLSGILLLLFVGSESPYTDYTLVIPFLTLLYALFLRICFGKNSRTYKRMLLTNGGTPPRCITTFTDNAILGNNLDNGNTTRMEYDKIRRVIETKNHLLLVMPYHLTLLVNKETLTGGSIAEFCAFLRARCPKLKRKKFRSPAPGRIVHMISVAVAVVGLFLSVTHLPGIQKLAAPTKIESYMSYAQIAHSLEQLGITGCTQEMLDELESYDSQDLYMSGSTRKVISLLSWMGAGEYDWDTWEWTPSASGVYWFDMEVLSPDTMYSDFLRGVSAASKGKLVFTDIQEDTSLVDWESGTGTQSVTFTWSGQPYRLEGDVMNDWFDTQVADDLAAILREQGTKEHLYFAFDGGQGFLVFYGTPRWASDFEAITGLDLWTGIH